MIGMAFSINIAPVVNQIKGAVNAQLPSRAYRAANELKNASLIVLRGQGGGRTYKKPTGGTYKASAPGSPPAVRTGTLRNSWRPDVANGVNPSIETGVPYTGYLEEGPSKMAARPFEQKIIDTAQPAIDAIYSEPYNI